MLKSQKKNSLIINNAIELGELTTEANGKGRKFTSRFIEAGVAHYEQFGDVLITKETLDKFIQTMVGCPVIVKHKDITDQNADKERVGVVSRVWFDENDGWFYCEGVMWDKQAIDLVKNQGWNVSCTYDFESDFQKGTYHGKEIDMEFTGGEFLHLALVPNPRYERATIVMNSQDGERWITVKGNHILIKDNNLADFLGEEKKSYAQFNAALSVYARAYKDNKVLQEEVRRIQQEVNEKLEEERQEEQKAQPKKDSARKTIEKALKSKNVNVVQYGEDGYSFLVTQGDGFGFSKEQANSLKKHLELSCPHLQVETEQDRTASKKEQEFEERYQVMATIRRTKNEDENGRWITVKGTHIFIPEGKDAGEIIEKKFGGTEGYHARKDYELLEQIHKYREDVSEYLKRKEEKSEKKEDDLKGKYSKEDADFDEEQAKKDIEEAKKRGYDTVEEISEYLGLDEDEVRGFEDDEKWDPKKSTFDWEDFKKFTQSQNSLEDTIVDAICEEVYNSADFFE